MSYLHIIHIFYVYTSTFNWKVIYHKHRHNSLIKLYLKLHNELNFIEPAEYCSMISQEELARMAEAVWRKYSKLPYYWEETNEGTKELS